jgi:hypothetical protein
VQVHPSSRPSTGGMNQEAEMEVTPHHSTADRAATAKKTREEAARKLKAACKEAAEAAKNATAGSGSGSGNTFKPPALPCPPLSPPTQNPPPNRGVSLLSSKEGAVSDAHPLPSPSGRYNSIIINPNENDQGRKGPCFFQRLIALKCLKCQKIKKNI